MASPIIVVAILKAHDGQADVLEQVLRACVEPSKAEAGCLAYALHRSQSEPEQFVFVERWTDMAAIELHRQQDHYVAMAEQAEGLVSERQVHLLEDISITSFRRFKAHLT